MNIYVAGKIRAESSRRDHDTGIHVSRHDSFIEICLTGKFLPVLDRGFCLYGLFYKYANAFFTDVLLLAISWWHYNLWYLKCAALLKNMNFLIMQI